MPGRILIVDDEKDMLALLRRIVSEETDHALVTETNPARALELFRDDPFDLVITDLKMPKVGGIKLLEEVKKIEPEVSVVVITAYATIETAVEAIQKGAYDYITKPFKRERILLTVDKAMKWQEMVKENLAMCSLPTAVAIMAAPMISETPPVSMAPRSAKRMSDSRANTSPVMTSRMAMTRVEIYSTLP